MVNYKKILVLGSGALKIGEAGEFDYSGSQAIKALKEEDVEVILINPNIATVQTSEDFADKVYFLPVTPEFVERIIEKEKPNGVLLSFGGQTALNCGVELNKRGVFKKHNVNILGTPISVIENTEDRALFVKKLNEIEVKTPNSTAVTSIEDALIAANNIGFPIMLRIAYALGGLGSGLCENKEDLVKRAKNAFLHTNQILIEEYLQGWKEVEYEVVRDKDDNCITVCNMENFDPLGIHTGESIVVAPSQTLTNEEYHFLREISIKTVRHLGVVGECNVQFALHAKSLEYRVIEVNARLSRSSALASKATGYPLAFVAAKLALGYSLIDLKNSVTKVTTACFEPALDYVTVKMPRWDLAKFKNVSRKIDSGMKSVGEVMAIGRKFEEALQKGLRMLDIGVDGLASNSFEFKDVEKELEYPTDERVFGVYTAIKSGMSIDSINKLTHIDTWFLSKIENIVAIENSISANLTDDLLVCAKQTGFSDKQIARICNVEDAEVEKRRNELNLKPSVKQIDTLAAEYPAPTNYLYTTYNGNEDDVEPFNKPTVIVLGGGAYRIGSSVEFDWCCVNSIVTLKELGFKTVMINCNPETVSTDYDICDRLYFEEITEETVIDICKREKVSGIILSMGGQTPNRLALRLASEGINILGTSAEFIDRAEDRHKFSKLLDDLCVNQPEWKELTTTNDALEFANRVGYPVLVRPSYVLSGAAMAVAVSDEQLNSFLNKAAEVSPDHPVVISKFILGAKEIEIDGVAKNGELFGYVISEHVENAGVHSGDATMVVPPQRMYLETVRQVKSIASKITKALEISGPFNIQFLAKNNDVSVIECNLRASRSFPFVSKVSGVNLIEVATKIMVDWPVEKLDLKPFNLGYVGVKAPHFSFTRLKGADPTLSVEMSSTGEVGCLGDDFEEAFLKALIAVGFKFPIKSVLLSTGPMESKVDLLSAANVFKKINIDIYATGGTAKFLSENNVKSRIVDWPLNDSELSADKLLRNGKIDLVINIPKNYERDEITNGYMIRRAAADSGIPIITNTQLAKRLAESLQRKKLDKLSINDWGYYLNSILS